METAIREALRSQYMASLRMLRAAIETCPDALWDRKGSMPPFWLLAYHTLFYTHLYLMQEEGDFQPWELCRPHLQFMDKLPWPPFERVELGEPYTKAELLAYLAMVEELVGGVRELDLSRKDCGFDWYSIPKLDHQINNIRHVQNHVGHLDAMLRAEGLEPLDWKA